MRLSSIIESNEIKTRVKRAFMGKGKTDKQGLWGISDEFECDLDKAAQYLNILSSGIYGEADIKDKTLHRARAPQCLLKLLNHFNIPKSISTKLIRFHIDNYKIIQNHKTSPSDAVVMQEMKNHERLVGMVALPKKYIESLGYVPTLAPWCDKRFLVDFPNGIWYICKSENIDIVQEIIKSYKADERTKVDLLHGLAFGYKMVDVFNYIRADNQNLVDDLCGHADEFST